MEHPQVPPELRRALLARYGIDPAMISDPYRWIKLETPSLLIEQAAALIGDPCLGARIGMTYKAEQAGPFGALFSASSSLADVFAHFPKFAPLIQSHTQMRVEQRDGLCVLSYRIHDPAVPMRCQDTEMTTASAISFIRGFLSRNWSPLEVQFAHAGQGREAALRQIFRAPVHFGLSESRIIIAAADVTRANPLATPSLRPVVLRHLEDLLARESQPCSLGESLRETIRHLLGRGPVTLQDVARELGFSVRTLQRRLQDERLNFRLLLEEERRGIAETMLDNPGLPMKQIAARLGYSELSGFSRACRGWTGKSPRAMRQAAQPGL
ncbi:AraC family transcriptional regulator [Acidocella facilis]|uniref:AraC family transcriptional regulator n=1 Tax=Acidocella facilis TaxID=525 RepID=UPI001F1EE08D|nr:AraC family transcriptional regulator [Acidocella facilis]